MKKYFTLSKQRGRQMQRLEVMKSLSWSMEERRFVRLKRVMSKMFSTDPGSKYFWLWWPHVLCWDIQLCYCSTKAATDIHKWMTVAVFQWNFDGVDLVHGLLFVLLQTIELKERVTCCNWKTVQWPYHVGPKSRSCNFNSMLIHW